MGRILSLIFQSKFLIAKKIDGRTIHHCDSSVLEVIKLTSSKYFDFELVYIEEIDFVFLSIFLGLLIEQFGLYRVIKMS